MSTFKDILDTINGLAAESGDVVDRVLSGGRAARSLSKASQDGILNFPVIVSDSITIEDATLVTKALEREYATFVLITTTMNPYLHTNVDNANASTYINKLHQNIDQKIDGTDILNTINTFANEASKLFDMDYDAVEGIKENMVYAIYENVNHNGFNVENMKYSYVIDDVTESTILNDVMKRRISSIYRPVTEANMKTHRARQDAANYKLNMDKFEYQVRQDGLRNARDQRSLNHNIRQDAANYKLNMDKFQHQIQQDNIRNAYNQRSLNHNIRQDAANYKLNMDKFEYQKGRDDIADQFRREENDYRRERDRVNDQRDANKFEYQRTRDEINDQFRQREQDYRAERDRIQDKQFEDKLKIDKFKAYHRTEDMTKLMDNDVKKANELVPTLLHMRIYPVDSKTHEELPPIDFVVGVKCTIHPVPSDDMITNVCRGVKNEDVMFNFLRWTTGEIKFFKDFVFGMNELKIDAINSGARSSKWWSALKRRRAMAKIKNNILPNKLLPNATLVLTQEEINTIKEVYGYDLKSPALIDRLMKNYFLLGFVIIDPALQRVSFLFDGRNEFDNLTYATLAREATTNDKQFKEMLNMLGRRI